MLCWLHQGTRNARKDRKSHNTPPRTLLFLERLEKREMLAAGVVESAAAALGGDVAQWRQDLANSVAVLVNTLQPSSTNTPAPAATANQWNNMVSVLATDFSRTWQAVEQFEFAVLGTYLQTIDTPSADGNANPSDQAPSPSLSAAGTGSGGGSTSSGHGSSSQTSTVLLSSHGSGSGSGSSGDHVRSASSPLLGSGSGSGSGSGGSVSGQVWLDSNHDGIEQPSETGMAGVTVTLLTEDSAGNVLNSTPTTTDANGNYYLPLPSGGSGYLYQVYVTPPSGYDTTDEDAGSSGTLSYVDPNGYSPYIAWGGSTTITAGLDYSAAPIAAFGSYSAIFGTMLTVSAANGVLANDTDPNNLPLSASLVSGPSNGTLQLNGDGSFTYTPNPGYTGSDSFIYSASDGTYSSNGTVTLSVDNTISGQVWLDSNEDGIENNGETGMSGITVDLVAPNGATASSTTTDANGDYLLAADSTLSSQYQIQVIIPQGYSATIPFASTSGIYSSIDYNGLSEVLTLPSTGGISNINAGLVSGSGPWASISGEVWLDSNDNGVLENGEPGLQGINVNLLDSSNNVLDSTSADANGDYSFFGLLPNTPYTVQFIAPSGYVFSPQNVGPPATSSSAGPNGATNPITLSPSQSDATVNAGLYGDAPIVYQTYVPMMAENERYTGIDFTADGYDPNGKSLTPVIVQDPTYGSITYNASDGLYDYTAPTGFTGEDSFQFKLSNGDAYSDVVTVQILAYGPTLPPGTYDSFPLVEKALYTPTQNVPLGDGPDPASVAQEQISACWFVAAAAGLAQQNPNQIVGTISYNAGLDVFKVTFPGENSVLFAGFEHDAHNYSTANGEWLAGLEKGYGMYMWNKAGAPAGKSFYSYIDDGNGTDEGIEILTGHETEYNDLPVTSLVTLRQNLTDAFNYDKVVVAGTPGGDAKKKMEANGLVANHDYTVVAYNATTDEVQLRNPWGFNPTSNSATFWMDLSEFKSLFGDIAFEQ